MSLQALIDEAVRANEQKLAALVQVPAHALSVEDELRVRRFEEWCRANGVRAIGAKPTTVAAYLASLIDGAVEAAEAIRIAHQIEHLPCPISTDCVRIILNEKLKDKPPQSWKADEQLLWPTIEPEVRSVIARVNGQQVKEIRRLQTELALLRQSSGAVKPVQSTKEELSKCRSENAMTA